jgi:hypothetical protein
MSRLEHSHASPALQELMLFRDLSCFRASLTRNHEFHRTLKHNLEDVEFEDVRLTYLNDAGGGRGEPGEPTGATKGERLRHSK